MSIVSDVIGRYTLPLQIAVAVAALGAGGLFVHRVHLKGLEEGRDEIQFKWDAEKLVQKQVQLMEVEKNRAKEKKTNDEFAQMVSEKDITINQLDASLGSALMQLRNRPSRTAPVTSVVPTTSCNATGHSGSELFREDAEFLTREATRADKLRESLGVCYRQYTSAKNIQNN